jgi:translation initiation factor 3 subunit C
VIASPVGVTWEIPEWLYLIDLTPFISLLSSLLIDSEDEVRVVKSTKDRTFDSLESSVGLIRNAMKIRDYAAIQTNFENLVKNVSSSRTQAIIVANGGLPRFFVKMLVDLDDYLDERKKDKAAFKKLSATQGRALNRMSLSLKKHNKQYEKIITEYRQNPGVPDEDDDEEDDKKKKRSDSDDDSDSDSSSSAPVVRKKKPAKVSDSDSDDVVSFSWNGALCLIHD